MVDTCTLSGCNDIHEAFLKARNSVAAFTVQTWVWGAMYRVPCMGCHVWGCHVRGCHVWGAMYGVPCMGCHVRGAMYGVPCTGCHVWGAICKKSHDVESLVECGYIYPWMHI